MKRLGGALALALLGPLLPSPAVAQPAMPGMPDVSGMSGIPRPDPSVPPGKLVVRVIRGDFAHPMVGTTVTLKSGGAPDRSATVGPDGRANFEGLSPGSSCTVSAQSGDQTVSSQPIPMPGEAGVKVMLVFKADEKAALGEHDGVARADKSLPAGTVLISVEDEAGKPLTGAPLVVAHGTAKPAGGQPAIAQTPLTTDDKGEARYVVAPGSEALKEGLMVSLKKDALQAASQPFLLDAGAGMRVGLRAVARSNDLSQVSIRSSHVIFELSDDAVQVMEVFLINNSGSAPVDPGPAGLVFPFPEGAKGGEALGEVPAGFTVAGGKATWRGAIPTGGTQVAFGVFLPMKEAGVELVQTLPVRLEQLQATTSAFPGIEVRGPGVQQGTPFTREGRSWIPIMGAPVEAGGTLRLSITGLPHKSPTARYLAVAISLLIGLWGLWAGFGGAGRGARTEVERLEAEKRQLLDELAALERTKAGTQKAESKQSRRHDELIERLEKVLRDLDDHHAE